MREEILSRILGGLEGNGSVTERIFLIGYRCTGKSGTGRALAHILACPFVDTDEEITAMEGTTIAEMVERRGWSHFRQLERGILSALMKKAGPLVVACGGGAVLHEDLFSIISKDCRVVWLRADPDIILARILSDVKTAGQRPALTDEASLADEVVKTLAERTPLYERYSHLAVDTGGLSPEAVAARIENWLREGK